MTETQLRELITQIVAEIVAKSPALSVSKPKGLVLFTGALLGFEEALAALGRSQDVQFDWTQTESASRILNQSAIEAMGFTLADRALLNSHDLLIVPTLTVNMVAKVVCGVADCLASNLIAEFIMSAKPVIMVTNAACPDSTDKRSWFPKIPSGYAQLLRDNLNRLTSFGVKLTAAENLDQMISQTVAELNGNGVMHCAEKVISQAVIKAIPPRSRLRISADAVVTDLAGEAAASAQILLERG